MPRQQSESSLDKLGFARNEEEKDFQVERVTAPLGGLYDLGNIFPVPVDGLTRAQNNTFESLALEKRSGLLEIGQRLTVVPRCVWGGQYWITNTASPPAEQMMMLRANSLFSIATYLFKLVDWEDADPNNWVWRGVLSGTAQGTAADTIGSGFGNGTVVVQAGRLYYADGGGARKVFLFGPPARIVDWGLNVGTPAAGTIASETTGGTGYLLTDRSYAFRYQIIDSVTGFRSELSAVSNVFLTTLAGDNSALAGTVPAFPSLPVGEYIVRIARSTGAIPPSQPMKYLIERDYTVTNLNTTPLTIALEMLDGDLGPSELTQVYPIVPRGRFVMYDPSGDRALLFGDPDNPNVVYWSMDGEFGNWPPIQQTAPIEDDSGDPLNGGWAGLNGRVFVMKRRRGIYELVQTINGAYSPQKITNAVGCWSHYSIANRGTSLYWLSLEGAIEFNGSEITNISDDKIRKLFETFAKAETDALEYTAPYAIDARKPGSPTISWIVRDPITSGIYLLTYNVALKNWTMQSSESGIGYSVLWHARDHIAGVGDGLEHIYIGSGGNLTTGSEVFRMGSNYNGTIYYDEYEGYEREYTWDVRTAWFGNGLDTYIPRYLDFLLAVQPVGWDNGLVTASLYVDGAETAQHSVSYRIPNVTNYPDQLFMDFRFRCDSRKLPCRMFRFGFKHTQPNGHPLVPWYEFKYTVEAPRLRGRNTGG